MEESVPITTPRTELGGQHHASFDVRAVASKINYIFSLRMNGTKGNHLALFVIRTRVHDQGDDATPFSLRRAAQNVR